MTTGSHLPGTSVYGTQAFADWIASLPDELRSGAHIALSELSFISLDNFESAIRTIIDDLVGRSTAPVAFYCVRDVRKDESGRPIPYFTDAHKIEDVRKDEPGSDWRVAHLLYRIRSEHVLYHPTLREIRELRVSDIVLVDDCSSSGTNIGNFLSSIHNNRTLYSWHSRGLIRYHVVLHTIGPRAERGIRKRLRANGRQQLLRVPPLIHAHRRDREQYSKSARAFFQATRPLLGRKWRELSLGFRNSQCATVFAHGCPNNVPAVIWDSSGTVRPLFPDRGIPTEIVQVITNGTHFDPPPHRPQGLTQADCLILDAIREGARTTKKCASMTGEAIATVDVCIDRLKALGLIDLDLRLTDDGKRCAATNDRVTINVQPLAPPEQFYYRRPRGQ